MRIECKQWWSYVLIYMPLLSTKSVKVLTNDQGKIHNGFVNHVGLLIQIHTIPLLNFNPKYIPWCNNWIFKFNIVTDSIWYQTILI